MFLIDIENFNGGASSATVENVTINSNNYIKFKDTDYIIFECDKGHNVYNENNEFVHREYYVFNGYEYPTTITASFILPNKQNSSERAGIISRYNKDTFNMIEIDEFGLTLKRYNGSNYVKLSNKRMFPVSTDTIHKITITENTNSYDIYIDDKYATTFIFNNTGDIGFYGFFGTSDVMLNEFKIETNTPKYFNKSNDNITIIKNNGIYIANIDEDVSSGYVYTDVNVTPNKEYCLRYTTNKQGYMEIHDGTSVINVDVENSNNTIFTPQHSSIQIRFIPFQSEYFFIEKLILVDDNEPVIYIKTNDDVLTEEKSIVSIPVNIDTITNLKLNISIKPYSNSSKNRAILELTDSTNAITLYHKDGAVCIKADQEYTTSINLALLQINNLSITIENYINKYKITISNEAQTDSVIVGTQLNNISVINVGYSINESFYSANSLVSELKIYKVNDIQDVLLYNFSFYGSLIDKMNGIKTTIFEKPKNFSPIIVDDGINTLTNTSYFDYDENQFTDYVVENVIINGKYIKVSFNNIDDNFFKPLLFVDDIYYICKSINNNIIEFDIPNDVLIKINGKEGKVKYKIKNSYSVLYNEDDTFDIILNDCVGQNVKVSYVSTEESSMPIMSVNLNPLMSHRNRGFIFLSHDEPVVEYIDVKLSKDSVDLELGEHIYIIIDAYDKYGNYVSNCDFTIYSMYGQATIIDTNEPVSYIQSTGRYIYKYTPTIDYSSYDGYIIDNVTIIETNSNSIIKKDIKILI